MSSTTTYEVYVRTQDDWSILSVFENRNQAVTEAQALIAQGRSPSVQVIEERFDASSGHSTSAIVFRGSRSQDAGTRAEVTFKRPQAAKSAPAPSRPISLRPRGFMPRMVLTVLALGSSAIALLIAFAAIVDAVG